MTMNDAISKSAALVKLVTAVGNNAAWLVMLDGYDNAFRCKAVRRSVKGGHTVAWHFKKAVRTFHDYERELLTANVNRMFHVADMPDNVKKKYSNISDEEYYEFWKGVGSVAYAKTKPLITSLWNKYRISLIQQSVNDAEHVAWVMTAQAALDLAGALYESAMEECQTGYGVPRRYLDEVFVQFSIKTVSKDWRRAMVLLEPKIMTCNLSDIEDRNIELGLRQLREAWMNHDILYSSASGAVEDYEEIFKTKGFQKKILREIAEVRAETIKALKDDQTPTA